MSEISKLRQRMININKNVSEYKMTVIEAKGLITEFTELENKLKEKLHQVVIAEPAIIIKTMDGGTF